MDVSPAARLVRHSDPTTSHLAAARVAEFAQGHEARILESLKGGPAGAEQIGDAIGIDGYAVRKRLAELQQAKKIAPTGESRRTRSGRSERIWRLA